MKATLNKVIKYSLITFIMVMMASCSGTKKFMYSIPADTNEIFAVKMNTIVEKTGIHKKKNKELKQQILETIKKEITADDFKQIENIINDLSKSGIDTKEPLYFFNAPSLAYRTIAGNLKSQKKLKKTLSLLEKHNLCEPLVEEKPYFHTVLANNLFIIFDKKTVLLIHSPSKKTEAAKKQALSLFTLPKEESIVKGKAKSFKEFRQKDKDLVFYSSAENIPTAYKRQIEKIIGKKIEFENIGLIGTIHFEKGETHLTLQFDSEELNLLAKNNTNIKPLKGNLLNLFPSNTIALFNMGINGKAIYKNLMDQENPPKELFETEIKDFIESLNGDISIGAFTMGLDKAKPNFLALIEANSKNIKLDSLFSDKNHLNLKRNEKIIKLKENEFLWRNFKLNNPLSQYLSKDLFLGLKDDYIYITNNELIYKDMGEKIDKTMKGSALTSNLKGKLFYTTFNIEEILDLPFIKVLTLFGGDEAKQMVDKISHFTHLEILNENKSNTIEVNLYQKESKQTLLELFLDDLIRSLPIAQ